MRAHCYKHLLCAGLINQMYSHIAAIMLARAMGAELVLAPAVHRESFDLHMEKTKWHVAPQESLLDVGAVKKYWGDRGLLIHTVGDPQAALPCTHEKLP